MRLEMVPFRRVNEAAFTYYSRLSRVRQFVFDEIPSPVTLEKAAKVAGLEKKYFSAFFRAKVGVGFRDWLRELQVRQAMELLESKNYSITEVAMNTGFGDLRTFERSFKRLTGETPKDYRDSVRPF